MKNKFLNIIFTYFCVFLDNWYIFKSSMLKIEKEKFWKNTKDAIWREASQF